MEMFNEASMVARHESLRALAQADASAGHHAAFGGGDFLIFRLGDAAYGIDIDGVLEIRSYEAPTPVVNAPDFVRGMLDLRGRLVPIVDLRLALGQSGADYNAFTAVVLLTVGERVLGLVVDSVSDVLELGPHEIQVAATGATALPSSHVLGIATVQHGGARRSLTLIDMQALIGRADLGPMGR